MMRWTGAGIACSTMWLLSSVLFLATALSCVGRSPETDTAPQEVPPWARGKDRALPNSRAQATSPSRSEANAVLARILVAMEMNKGFGPAGVEEALEGLPEGETERCVVELLNGGRVPAAGITELMLYAGRRGIVEAYPAIRGALFAPLALDPNAQEKARTFYGEQIAKEGDSARRAVYGNLVRIVTRPVVAERSLMLMTGHIPRVSMDSNASALMSLAREFDAAMDRIRGRSRAETISGHIEYLFDIILDEKESYERVADAIMVLCEYGGCRVGSMLAVDHAATEPERRSRDWRGYRGTNSFPVGWEGKRGFVKGLTELGHFLMTHVGFSG
jgi:hypothetical protein